MKIIKIPYDKGYKSFNISKNRVAGILESKAHSYKTSIPQKEIVKKSLQNPIQSQKLSEVAKSANKVLIITSDHTRPVPSKITLPILLDEIRSNNPNVKIKVLIATGFHRPTTIEEMKNKFGEEIVNNEDIINHISTDEKNMVFKGTLPSGGELWLNSLIDWADLIVSEGFIEPHFFAGFSGGRKSILPGIASSKTVLANHCSEFIADSNARTGSLDKNPIHKDMVFASEVAKLKFILNVVIDSDKKIINAFAGHPQEAHLSGCKFVKELASINPIKSDIVITSNGGYPLDQNIYQAVKGMTAAEACVNPGGVIIMVSACSDGHGGEAFYNWFVNAKSAEEVTNKIAGIPQDKTIADQWEAQILARILIKAKVIIVSDLCDYNLIKDMHMLHCSNIDNAIKMAEDMVGKDSKITIIPDGVSVIVK
jgi:nickel-dependent lactate racemase